MNELVRFFYRFFYWVVPWWYGLTMTLTRKRRYPEVMVYDDTEQIIKAIKRGRRWREDPLRGFLDVMMSPRKFQAHIDKDANGLGDCDDHAIYWATALLKGGLADRASLGTVWYAKPGSKKGWGHVVCIFEHDGMRFWTDYGEPRRTHDIGWDWAVDVATLRGATCLAAGEFGVTLRKSGEPKLSKRVRVYP